MANTLMFEVGVSLAKEQFDKIKTQIEQYSKTWQNDLGIKVQIANLDQVVKQLGQIGDNKDLRNLRQEIESLNKEFAKMAAGAGGVGSPGVRAAQQEVAGLKVELDNSIRSLERLRENLDVMRRNRDMAKPEDKLSFAQPMRDLKDQISAQEELIKKRQVAYDKAVENAEKVANATKNATQQETESMRLLKQQVVGLTDKIRVLEASLTNKGVTSQGSILDPQKFTTLHEAIDKIIGEITRLQQAFTHLGENSSLSNLTTYINGLAVTLGSLSNAIKLQPLDDQVKALLERCERAETKLREVGDAARYLNERAGERTQQKASTIAGIAGVDEAQLNKVSDSSERFLRLLVLIENEMARIGKIQVLGEQSGFTPTLLKNAQTQLEALKKAVESTIKGTPIAEGLVVPATNSQLAQFIQQFGLLKAQYKDIIKEADKYNAATEKNSKAEQKRLEKEIALQQKIDELRRKTYSNLGIREKDPGLQTMQTALDNIMQKLAKVRADIDLYRQAIGSGNKESIDFGQKGLKEAEVAAEVLMRQYAALYEAMERLRSGGNERPLLSTVQQNKELEILNETFRKGVSELQKKAKAEDDAAKAAKKANDEAQKAAERAAKAQERAQERIQNAARRTSENLVALTDRLDAKKINFKGMDFTELDTAIGKIRAIKTELDNFASTGRSVYGNTAKEIVHNMGLAGANEDARIALSHLTTGKKDAEKASRELSDSEQRLANAIKGTTDSMHGQSQVISDLKTMAMQYLSVWGAQSFVNSIIETGGLLEQQRLSLSAILGDVEKANTLFGQVKELALKSPFGVVQIDKMTKQLAAYSFEYEDLFDWTKRLADISAATGTSVDRLALALGHVRSEGALSGYTLRQFAMANVPVLKMLSENLGISSKEVRERVRKKEIGAEDVQDILKQLTDEGGMFYNAQEVMSQALNAKFKNLRDAFDIMYGEIAESGVGDRLKELAVILTQGAKEWERFGKDILAVGAAFGIGRVAVLLYNTALGEGTAATLKNIAAIQQKENAHLRLARAAGLVTETEYKQLVFNERYSVSALKVAIVENKLTIEELQRAVALGKVNKAVAQAAVVSAGYNASLISNVKVLAGWRKGIFLVGEGFRAATLAVKGFLASAWPLLALSVVFDLVNRTSQNNDAAKDAAEGAAKATNKYQDLQAMTERLGSSQKKTNDQLENNIKAMKESLTACGEYTEELKKQVESVETLAEKYDILLAAMKRVSDKASDKQDRKKNLIEEGLATGSGTAWAPWNWFRDNALKDAKDIDDYTQELYLVLDKNDKVLREGFKKILTTRKEWKDKFESMSAKDIFMSLGVNQKDDVLYRLRWEKGLSNKTQGAGYDLASVYYGSADRYAEYSGYSYLGALKELKGHKEELAKAFADAFRVDHPEIDLSKADDEQKVIFAKWLDQTIANLEDVKEAGKKALNDIVIEGTIGVRPKYSLDNENWEKFLEDFKEKNPLAYYEWNKHETTGGLTEENKRKSLESYGKTFSGMTDSTLGNTSKKQLKELKAERARLKAEQASAAYREELEVKKRVDNRLAEVDKEERRLKQAQKDFNQYGDPDKNKGRGEDKEAKALRERVRILKEAETSYQYWRKAVGDAASATHVEDEFGKILSEQNFSFENVEQYKKTLEELRAKYQGIYDTSEKAGKKRPQLLEAIKEIDKILADMGRKDFEKKTEEFLSKTQIELDGLTRSWEIFNSVREATGNIELAVQISGADYASGKTRNLADALKEKIQKDFKDAGGAGLFYFDVNLSDKQIKELIENGAPKTSKESAADYEKRIAGIVDEYKKWRDLQRDVEQKDVETFNKLVSSAVDLQSELSKISDEYNRIIQSLDRMKTKGRITEKGYNQAKAIADADFQMKAVQARNEYKFLMDGVVTMNKKAAQIIRNEYINALQAKLKAGTITAKDYADKIQEINDKMRELENAPSYFQSYTQGGFQSFFENLMNRGKSYTQQGAALYQQGSKETVSIRSGGETLQMTNLPKMMQGEQMSKMGASMMQGAQSAMSAMAIIDAIIHGINDAVQSMKGIFDDVRGMFKALGRDVDTDSWQDANTFFSTFSKASQQATNGWDSLKNGNVGGAIQGTVGSITSWFTGFAEGHDRKREKHIQDLKFEVTKISNTLDLIKSLRERTLGYDKGELRRLLANQYSNNYTDAGRDMYEYYSRGGLDGTGYQQEFNALKKQRELYQEMYDSEADKKDSSDEALEEYKNKMADLDQQIMFFAQDLANELFSIDIKGWADQISDSLMTAFENGEDAAKSFKDTVEDIMKDVVKRMLSVGVIQPMMAKLQKKLFGENGTGGSFDAMNPEGTIDAALRDIADFFGEGGEGTKAINAAQLFYDKTEAMLNSRGLTLSEKESSNSLSSNIKGITEQTADLLAAYLNAVRADVSVNRAMIAQYYPLFYAAMTGGNASLQNIENHTAAIMRSNDAINRNVEDLRSDFHGLKTGVWKMPIA